MSAPILVFNILDILDTVKDRLNQLYSISILPEEFILIAASNEAYDIQDSWESGHTARLLTLAYDVYNELQGRLLGSAMKEGVDYQYRIRGDFLFMIEKGAV